MIFEALRGVSYRGDIAIDDIRMAIGSCNPSELNELYISNSQRKE